MFTKAMYETDDMQSQHDLLNQAADLFDQGILKTTFTQEIGVLSVENLTKAHAQLESGSTIGKVAMTVS
ncbi:MAG: zinc-binding dehydrogenase [Phormidesmis sp.]